MRRAVLPKNKQQLEDKAAKKIKRYHQGMDGDVRLTDDYGCIASGNKGYSPMHIRDHKENPPNK